MEYREMLYIRTIAKYKSITKASEELFIAQPSLTQALHRAENEYGAVFFYRSKTGLKLTDAGQMYLDAAEKMENLYNEAKARGIDFKLVRNDDFSYIVCGGEVFLFPWFDAISYSDVERRWLVDISGDPYPLSDDFSYEIKKLAEEYRNMPVRVLVRESDLMPRNDLYGNGSSEDRARVLLPEYICLCSDFVSALEERSRADGK